MAATPLSSLGSFLKSRRARLDPSSFGYAGRRRTPGLRREEVAQRANISATWYTWLEQGRGGAPSAEVLDRIGAALMLTDAEREHLFLLGLGRPPEPRPRAALGLSSRVQRVLDAMPASPAILKNATWDVLAWNRAAAVVFTDYGALPPGQRNILRFLFRDSAAARARQHDWDSVARVAVGAFRADAARAGLLSEAAALAEELSRASPEFAALWRDHEVHGHGEGVKRLRHPQLGAIDLDYSTLSIDGRPDLSMIVFTPVDAEVAARIAALAAQAPAPAREAHFAS